MSVGAPSVTTVFLASPEIIDAIPPFLDNIATRPPPSPRWYAPAKRILKGPAGTSGPANTLANGWALRAVFSLVERFPGAGYIPVGRS
jgi:hypothetical protein